MTYRLGAFADVGLDEAFLKLVIDEQVRGVHPRLDKLWAYYRNPLRPVGMGGHAGGNPGGAAHEERAGWYTLGQELGLPSRIVGRGSGHGVDDRSRTRREVVVENDIAWRVQSMIDFMFGKPVGFLSTAREESTRESVERALDLVWEASGGISLLQDFALLGHVFGWVDLLVRVDEEGLRDASRGCESGDPACVARCAEHIRIELVDPRRGIPIVDPSDYRRLLAYVVHFEREHNAAQRRAWWKQVGAIGGSADSTRIRTTVTQVLSGTAWQEYAGDKLVEEHDIHWSGGETPVVHVQNISEPFRYEGLGEVEALIPLQDELNTRLSDRACRVTMQSFKMYLAKGIEGFEKTVVGPGQVWATDNADASVESFGGDGHSPSEDSHIAQIRDAMDKASGVPPLASGVVQGRIGNLSSANALRVTLMSVLAKTARKRVTYGRGMEAASRLVLAALHWSGALRTLDTDRGVRVQWPDPLPTDERERVLAAEGKQRLGVSQDRLLAELGYSASDPGVV